MKNSVKKKLMLMTAKAMGAACAAQMAMFTAFAETTTTKKKNNPDADLDKVTEPIIGLVNRCSMYLSRLLRQSAACSV